MDLRCPCCRVLDPGGCDGRAGQEMDVPAKRWTYRPGDGHASQEIDVAARRLMCQPGDGRASQESDMPARSFSQHLLLPSVLELLVPNSLLLFPGLHGLSGQDEPAPALPQTLASPRKWTQNAFCTHMNLDLPIPSSHCCHGSLGRCKDVAHYHSGAALPEFNDFGLILPFFPLFLACSSSEPGLGWVIIACAGLSPGIHVCRCHILNLLMRSSQGMAVPWVVWLCQGAGGDPQLSTTSPGTPVLHRPGRLFSWKFIF